MLSLATGRITVSHLINNAGLHSFVNQLLDFLFLDSGCCHLYNNQVSLQVEK
jgi:hypothetical protein